MCEYTMLPCDNILCIFCTCCSINRNPLIFLNQHLIRVPIDKYRLHIVHPIIEVYIVFYCYLGEIHRISRHKKWETKIPCNILSMAPHTKEKKYKRRHNTNKPEMMPLRDDKEINIRVLMCCIHREWIHHRHHLYSWYPGESPYIFLCACEEIPLMLIWRSLHSHICIEFLFIFEHITVRVFG